jgi:hypothetical protein
VIEIKSIAKLNSSGTVKKSLKSLQGNLITFTIGLKFKEISGILISFRESLMTGLFKDRFASKYRDLKKILHDFSIKIQNHVFLSLQKVFWIIFKFQT